MMRVVQCILLAVGLFGVSCSGWVYDKEIAPNYSLSAMDSMAQLELEHCDGQVYLSVVGPTVTAIGVSKSHIIVKQSPYRRPGGTDWSRTLYFVVVLPKDSAVYPKEGIHGPMSYEEFLQARIRLGVPADLKLREVP